MKQYIKYIGLTISIALFLSACSGGGGDASFQGAGSTTISIGITCVTSPSSTDISGYVTLQSGDVIIKDDSNTSIEIYHDVNGLKKVCLVSGSAHILR